MKNRILFALISLSLLTTALFAQTSPQIPEEARRHFVKGTTLFDMGTKQVVRLGSYSYQAESGQETK